MKGEVVLATAAIYVLALGFLGYSFFKDKEKTKKAIKIAGKSMVRLLPGMLMVVGLVGLILGLISPETIGHYLGAESGPSGTFLAAIFGALTLIPSMLSFPLAASLLEAGASITTVAAFITTLVMVGFVTAPMEIRELGKEFTILRNGLAFIFAIIIALIMGVIL